MQAIGTDDKVVLPLSAGPESNFHMRLPIVDLGYVVPEDRLEVAAYFPKEQLRQRAAPDGHIASTGEFEKNLCAEAGNTIASRVDDSHLLDMIASPIEIIGQAHALCDSIAQTPKIDHIAAATQCRSLLDQGRLEASRPEPEGQGRASNSSPRNENGFYHD